MKLTIETTKDNVLLGRKEIKATLDFEGTTPSNKDLAEAIAGKLSTDSKLVIMKSIYTHFSQQNADVEAFVYNDLESLQKTEKMTKHLRKKMEEDKKKQAEAKEAAKAAEEEKKEEAPVEEKKEESADKEETPTTPEDNKEAETPKEE